MRADISPLKAAPNSAKRNAPVKHEANDDDDATAAAADDGGENDDDDNEHVDGWTQRRMGGFEEWTNWPGNQYSGNTDDEDNVDDDGDEG